MAGYIGSKSSVTQVDGYNQAEADAEFVNDPNSVITVSGSNVGINTSSPTTKLQSKGGSTSTPTDNAGLIANASASFVVDHANDYGLYTGYVASANDAIGIAATRTLGSALPLSLQPFGGNVGIGTTSPRSALDIDGGVDTHIRMQTNSTGSSSLDGLLLGLDGSPNALAYFWNYENAPVIVGTNNAERMRIDSSGNLLVGTTSLDSAFSGVQLRPTVSVFSSTSDVAYFRRNLSNGGVLIFQRDASVVGSVTVTASSTSYNTSSDYRLKTDAQPMTGASARVQALNPVNFEWIADGTRVDGFLAHEAQEVVPEAVSGTKDAMMDEEYEVTPAVLDDDGNVVTEAVMGTRSVPDYQGIDQSKLVPLLTAALQEALTKIDDMETRLAALEAV